MIAPPSPSDDSCAPVLLVDDEPELLFASGVTLRTAGIAGVFMVDDSRRVLPFLSERETSVVVIDLAMPHIPGTELIGKIRELFPRIPVIVMTGMNDVATAVACMKEGAFDYLVKPVEPGRFVTSVRRALEIQELRNEISSLKKSLLSPELEHETAFSAIVTNSGKMRAIFRYVEVIAGTGHPVLISGETGVGKDLVARTVHDLSGCKGAYVPLNVAGLDDALFSDTLFGHKRGAFTGADQAREGLIAQASGGTLFLDEVGDMGEASQVKLLRLLEQKTFYPLGADLPRHSDARVVCATGKNLKVRMAEGKFRKDLYYRLSGHHIHVPPLRQRPEDIPLLADHFLEEAADAMGKKRPTCPPELPGLLSAYHFPGNVRELKAMVVNAVAQHRSGVLSMESFRKKIGEERTPSGNGASPAPPSEETPLTWSARFPTLKETEEYLVSEALRRSGNNQGIAATLLGITRQALNKRLRRNGNCGREAP